MVIIERQETISGGNFHGEYPAKALDYLAIGVHELGSISERRIERLCNPGKINKTTRIIKCTFPGRNSSKNNQSK